MLLMTGVQIELIKDPEMYNFMFGNIRGGVTTINHRHAKANNPYLLDYDESLPTSYILYLVNYKFLSELSKILQMSLFKHNAPFLTGYK